MRINDLYEKYTDYIIVYFSYKSFILILEKNAYCEALAIGKSKGSIGGSGGMEIAE